MIAAVGVNCRRPFRVIGDTVGAAYEMLIFDCYDLMKEKRYGHCILNLAQAYEVFFRVYLHVSLLYRPFARQRRYDLSQLNALAATLRGTVKGYPFDRMRNVFMNLVLDGEVPSSLNEAKPLSTGYPS